MKEDAFPIVEVCYFFNTKIVCKKSIFWRHFEMECLINEINRLAGELVSFTEELEDHFDSPELEKKLEYFRVRLNDFKSYKPADMGGSEAERNEKSTTLCGIQFGCGKALDSLDEVTAESDVFDIIDALRGASRAITTLLLGDDLSYNPYDVDDMMEAERVGKELSGVLFDDEDETEYLSYDRGISAKGEDWHEDN